MKDPGVRFHLLTRGRRTLAVASAFREEAPFLFDGIDGAAPVGWVQGRRRHPVVALSGGRRVVVRKLVHGGILGRALGEIFWGANRPLKEFIAMVRASEKGIPVPAAVGARIDRLALGFYRGDLLSLEIAGALDLGEILRGEWQDLPAPRRARLLAAAGRALRQMHDAGLYHPDLNLKNVLLRWDGEEPTIFFVDLDGARFYQALTFRQRRSVLWRLARSADKIAPPGGEVAAVDRLRFLCAYAGADADLAARLRRSFVDIPSTSVYRRFWWAVTSGGPS